MSIEQELIYKLTELERRLDNLVQPERGWTPHWLATPYTNASFNGDSFSDVGANTLIDNAGWSTTIPATAKALQIRVTCRDSDSNGTTGLYFKLFPAAAAATGKTVYLNGIPNDQYKAEDVTIPCTDGDVWYQCNASGAGTLDVWLEVWGYWA